MNLPHSPQDVLRIGLILGYGLSFFRDILRGIKAYSATRPNWLLTPIPPERKAIRAACERGLDGYIGHIFTKSLASELSDVQQPVVNVAAVLPQLPFSRVGVDHHAVGRLAASHLHELGVKVFAFVGHRVHQFSLERQAGYMAELASLGKDVRVFLDSAEAATDLSGLWHANQALRDWLQTLYTPIGLFTSNDVQAVQVAEYCRELGLRVPEDVAIVGVDNDDLLCELARPSLSSVAIPAERIGFSAASLLDDLMTGQQVAPQSIVLPPLYVVPRQSSDRLTMIDPLVAQALRYIEHHADQPLSVDDILKQLKVARRTLERKFNASLSRGIAAEVRRVHINRAKTLLVETSLDMATVAVRSGFTDSRQLSVVFRQELGQTPSEYRHANRLESPQS
jgi:LacI family transcriptional regulator